MTSEGVRLTPATPGCQDDERNPVAVAQAEADARMAQIAVSAGIASVLSSLPPAIYFNSQTVPDRQEANYDVVVFREPSVERTLRVDYGDGHSDTAAVASGRGATTVRRRHHLFGPKGGVDYSQQATVVETGASSAPIRTTAAGPECPY